MLDFAALPPEINSGRMYAGPGSGPMMAAAAAWDEIAAELGVAASGYNSVVSELAGGPWVGPASMSMVSAVTPYVTWLRAVGAQAEETAGQGRAAAAAFEAAFAMTVPPPVIAANRVLLMNLIATNFFGQNSPAIATTEAQYMGMWAQDAVAMYGYTGSSAAASQLVPFTAPPNTTTADGESNQAAAVTQAVAEPAGTTAQTAAPQIASSSVGATTASTTSSTTTTAATTAAVAKTTTSSSDYSTVLAKSVGLAYFSNGMANSGWSIAQQLTSGPGGATAGSAGAWYPTPQFAMLGLGNLGGGAASHLSGAGVSAAAGQATQVGALSVPQQWATLTSALRPETVSELEGPPVHVAATGAPAGPNALLHGLPAGATGRRGGAGYLHKYGFRYSVLTRPPSAG